MKLRFIVLCCLVVSLISMIECKKKTKNSGRNVRQCGDERCRAGRRCATRYDGEKTCVCREKCKPRKHMICGSDGKTYTNYCHLHRSACLDNKHVSVLHQGHCLIEFDEVQNEAERKVAAERRPLVCYQVARNELRELLVDWLKSEVLEGKSYDTVVMETFKQCDEDKDGSLDGDELLKCTEKHPSEIDTRLHILRGLCMDALINMSDDDDNWILNQDEFSKLLNLHFVPPIGECQLDGKKYKDGSQTKLACNVCVCACGNWVCTGAPCFKGKEMGVPGPVVDGKLPGKEETEELLEGFQAVKRVKLSDINTQVTDNKIKDEIIEQLENIKNVEDKMTHM